MKIFKIELFSKLSNKEIELELEKILENWKRHDAVQTFKIRDISMEEEIYLWRTRNNERRKTKV